MKTEGQAKIEGQARPPTRVKMSTTRAVFQPSGQADSSTILVLSSPLGGNLDNAFKVLVTKPLESK